MHRIIILILLASISTIFSSPALAAISFVGDSLPTTAGGNVTIGAGRGFQATIPIDGTLTAMTVQRPTGVQVGDALVAQFIVRPQGTTITSPSGWNLLRRTTQTSGGNNTPPCGLDIISYFRILQPGDPVGIGVSDTWYISYPFTTSNWPAGGVVGCTSSTSVPTTAIGGMLAFRGQFPLSAVYYSGEDTVNNGSSVTHFAATINVGVTNTMVISGIGFLSSYSFGTTPGVNAAGVPGPTRTLGVEATQPTVGLNQWAGPSGERADNGVGLSLQMAYFNQAATGATGRVTTSAATGADNGVGHMIVISEAASPINLAITKTAVVTTAPNQVIYTIAAKNNGATVSEPGPIKVVDNLPSQLTYVSGAGTNWTCARALQTVNCSYNVPLAAGATTPNLTITTSYTATAVVNNCASVTGTFGDANFADNTVCRNDSIGGAVVYSGSVYNDADRSNSLNGGESGIGQTLYVKVTPRTGSTCTGPATKVAPTDAISGAYAFDITNGNYCLILSTNNNLADITAIIPASYIGTQQSTGIDSGFVAGGTPQTTLNFGLYQPANIKIIKTLSPVADGGKFNLTVSGGSPIGGTNPANDVVNAGTTNYVSVTRSAAITVQETAGTGTNLANYATILSCTQGDGTTAVTLTSSDLSNNTTRSGTFTAPATGLVGTLSQVICTFTNTAYDYDYGDAPSGGTTVETIARNYGSAAHIRPAVPSVYLGITAPDSDTAANQTAWQALATALGDDGTGTTDEDIAQLLSGAPTVFPALSAGDTNYSVTLVCAGNGATVAGWIDFNKNGTFDAGERQSGICASNAVTLNWSGLTGLKTGSSFARFRIASVAGEVANPAGVAADGEVEDYTIAIRPGVKIVTTLAPTSDTGTFDLTVSGGNPAAPAGSSNPAGNVGNTGTTGFIAVDTAGTITVQEKGNVGAGTNLSNYSTTLSCTLGDGTTAVTLTASDVTNSTTRGGTFTAPASNSTGTAAQVICTVINTAIITGVNVTGQVYSDSNHNGFNDTSETWTGGPIVYAKLFTGSCPATGTAASVQTLIAPTGAYTFTGVTAGSYCIVLSNNATASNTVASPPIGWFNGTPSSGALSLTVASVVVPNQNFGLFSGSKLAGRVFSDLGTSGGTANDGIQNGVETGISGVTITANQAGCGGTCATALTDGNGDYVMYLPPSVSGALTVTESNPTSYLSTGGQVGTTLGSYDRSTDSVTFTAVPGSSFTGINFADVPEGRFLTDNSATALPGSVVFHSHSFTSGSGGSVAFSSTAIATPSVAGWSEVFYSDDNCDGTLESGEAHITAAISFTAGQQKCILMKEFVPANAPFGASNQVTTTATFTYSNAPLPILIRTYLRTDTTTVGSPASAGLTLTKTVDQTQALPGANLIYTITYGNKSSGALNDIVIHDSVPSFTSLTSTPLNPCCVNPTSACLGTGLTAFPNNISKCDAATIGDSITWTLTGTLAPGASGKVKFGVTVQP